MDMQTIIRDIFNEKKEVYSTVEVAKKLGKGKKVLAIAPDGGEKYLSVEAYK